MNFQTIMKIASLRLDWKLEIGNFYASHKRHAVSEYGVVPKVGGGHRRVLRVQAVRGSASDGPRGHAAAAAEGREERSRARARAKGGAPARRRRAALCVLRARSGRVSAPLAHGKRPQERHAARLARTPRH